MNGRRSKQIRRAAARANVTDKQAKRAYYEARHPRQPMPAPPAGYFCKRIGLHNTKGEGDRPDPKPDPT